MDDHEEDSQVEGVLGDIARNTPEYDPELQAARKEKFLAQADAIREERGDGGNDKDDCVDKVFQFLLLAVTFGSMIINS